MTAAEFTGCTAHVSAIAAEAIREIARRTGFARNTVRAILRTEGLRAPQPRPRASKLEPYHGYVLQRYGETGLSAVRLHAEITAQGWAHVFAGDAVMAAAALDRLLHKASVVHIRGDSFRLRERRKAQASEITV